MDQCISVAIRRASLKDIPLIREMASVVFVATYRSILSSQQLQYMMEWMYSFESLRSQMSSGHVFFIAPEKGYVSLREDNSRDGMPCFHLEKLYVMPEIQHHGVGRALFLKALDYVRSQAPRAVMELNVNRNNSARAFYERMGMRIIRSGDFPIGNGFFMNDYIMGFEIV
ncbi:MAG: GNAT family N-acetyltransferase [Alistipes sp.]|nr:GNAT family N-acetyltransferase [Candidatus Alistipes equi]